MQVPSRLEWGMQKKAHDTAQAVPQISVGPHPRTSIDFLLTKVDHLAEEGWHELWKQRSYRGQSVYDIEGPKGKPLLPSTHKGGLWLKHIGHGRTDCFAAMLPLGSIAIISTWQGMSTASASA